MLRSRIGWLALCSLLVACQANVGRPKVTSASPKASSGAAASAKPAASASPTAAVSPVPTTVLAGLVKMDASYVISAGGGNVISAGGGNVISAGGGNLIKVGGQVISAGGGNVISAGGGNYRLLAIDVPFGEMLPASGMAVVAVSLRTGEPLGEAVLTNGEGRYSLRIPKAERGNVRLVAAVPGKTATDPRLANLNLQSEALASGADTTDVLVDDDRALVSRYFRQAFVGRMAELLDIETLDPAGGSPSENPIFQAIWNRLISEAVAAKSAAWPESRKLAVAERLADNLIYFVDLDSAKVDAAGADWPDAKPETCFEAYTDIVRRCRLAAIARMAPPNDAYFDTQPFVADHNSVRPAAERVKIRKATDLGAFITRHYFSEVSRYDALREVFESLGVDPKQIQRLRAAEQGLMLTIGITLATNTEAQEAILSLIRNEGKK